MLSPPLNVLFFVVWEVSHKELKYSAAAAEVF